MTTVSTTIAAVLERLEADSGFELDFIRHNPTGKVHILLPRDPAYVPGRDLSWAEAALEAAKPIPTVCGYQARRDGSVGMPNPVDEPVSSFPDDALCERRHELLGPWQHPAFEHPTEDLTGHHVRSSLGPRAWDGTQHGLARLPHGTPVLRSGRLQAGTRDASFLNSPDVHTIKAPHVAVVSHSIAIGSGCTGLAAACDTRRVLLDDSLLCPAASVHTNGRCRRRACATLYRQADAS